MARISTTEFCPECEKNPPSEVLAKSGRAMVRVFQDLDTGKFECAKGHEVVFDAQAIDPIQPLVTAVDQSVTDAFVRDTAPASSAIEMPEMESAVAVEEMPPAQAAVAPGSARMRPDHRLEVALSIPEQFVEPLKEFCQANGRTVEEYLAEFMDSAFQNGWIL